MKSARHPKSTATTRSVTTRRVAFDHERVGVDRHFLDDDIIGSHLIAVLSGVIPPGERFVAETVRRYRGELDGPLRNQANAFVGQERIHQREHDRFNKALARLGYPTVAIDRASALTFALAAQLPARLQVAMTAAIEHWTAVIAEHVLADEQLDQWQLADEARAFLAWHLVEELEHRAVAFDTMQEIGTREPERILAMGVVIAMLAPSVVGGFVLSLATDRSAWSPGRLHRSVGRLRRSPVAGRTFLRDLLSYGRLGFHPDERPIDDLLERWNHELFGEKGLVTTYAKHGAA